MDLIGERQLNWLRCQPKPIGCGKPLLETDYAKSQESVDSEGTPVAFRDSLSAKEYSISGLCQDCQNVVFVGEEELPDLDDGEEWYDHTEDGFFDDHSEQY